MTRTYSASKHLYTLNQSKISSSDEEEDANSSLEEAQLSNIEDYEDNQKEFQKLVKKNDELNRIACDLQLKNQQLQQLYELAEKRNQKHQEKQRDLIKKLSYFQVSNKQMSYEIRKISQDFVQNRENKKVSQSQINQIKQSIKRSMQEKQRFVLFLKNLFEMLRRCDKPEEYLIEKEKILQSLQKNIIVSENNHKINCQFDLKFELSRIDTLKEKNKGLEEEINQCRTALQKERGEKKKLISSYNQKITKLRGLYDSLKQKVQIQEEQNRRKLKSILNQKNQLIQSLKSKLKQSHVRKSSFDIKKSKESKKSFIGDGEYSHMELNELNEAIQNLQMQIIKQFEE